MAQKDGGKKKKVLVSGIQPSGFGGVHLGNYLGAMKQFVLLQDEYDTFIAIVNYHALTTVHDARKLKAATIEAAIDHLAVGLDPKKATLFLQSDVPQVTELAWIFNTLITVPYLSRAHAYKDKIDRGLEATVGLFDYPVLMAADILLPEADVVPVGEDQKQHIEMTRDIAEKFNAAFGVTFALPEPLIKKDVAVIPGTDGKKMSKSYGNTIPLFAENEEIEQRVMSIVTDSKGAHEPKDPMACNVFALHKHFSAEQIDEIKKRYLEGDIGYKESKEILIENLKAFIAPLREKRAEIARDRGAVLAILEKGGKAVREWTEAKMKEIRKKIGVNLYNG